MLLIILQFAIPLAALAAVPFYNRLTPGIFGFPFFYWYQLLWVPLTSLLTYFVYLKLKRDTRDDG